MGNIRNTDNTFDWLVHFEAALPLRNYQEHIKKKSFFPFIETCIVVTSVNSYLKS